MKIMILEDMKEDSEQIKNVISNNYPKLPIFQSKDRQEMLDYIEEEKDFTLYFLDIFIGKEALGLEIARKIVAKNNGLIIFTTAYPDTILQKNELQTHTFNIIDKENGNFEKQVLNALELALAHSNQQCFVIRRRNQTIFIPLDSILYLESVKGTEKTLIVAEYGYFQANQLLKECEKQLDKRFVRSRRTNIVNKTKIRQIDFKEQLIHFDHGITCPLIKGGSKGIAIIDYSKSKAEVTYVFDVDATQEAWHKNAKPRLPHHWHIDDPKSIVIEWQKRGLTNDTLSEQINKRSTQLLQPIMQEQSDYRAIHASISYVIHQRCGFPAEIAEKDFEYIQRQDMQSIACLGTLISKYAQDILRDIESIARKQERIREIISYPI